MTVRFRVPAQPQRQLHQGAVVSPAQLDAAMQLDQDNVQASGLFLVGQVRFWIPGAARRAVGEAVDYPEAQIGGGRLDGDVIVQGEERQGVADSQFSRELMTEDTAKYPLERAGM